MKYRNIKAKAKAYIEGRENFFFHLVKRLVLIGLVLMFFCAIISVPIKFKTEMSKFDAKYENVLNAYEFAQEELEKLKNNGGVDTSIAIVANVDDFHVYFHISEDMEISLDNATTDEGGKELFEKYNASEEIMAAVLIGVLCISAIAIILKKCN